MSILSTELVKLVQELSQHLSQYESSYATLQERIEALERELRDRTALVDAFAIVSETDTRGIITYANKKFCEVSQYSLEELIGKPHNIIRHPDMPKSVFKELWDTIKAGKIWQGEVKNRRKDGSHYWVYATVGPLLDADGYPYRYISMRIDITKQKDLEEALRRERALIAEELRENLQFAGTLQQLLMPPLSDEARTFSIPYFVLLKPLQVVSGDFVWMHEDKGRVLVFVGDSIGHGVSGAFVSTLFIENLRHLVLDRGIWSPEMLAEELDSRLGQLFRHKLPVSLTVDGSIALIDLHRRKLAYLSMRGRGAWVRNGMVTRLEAHPFSFGELLGRAAKESSLELKSGDRLYFYSDGVQDQLGGPEGKRWGTRAWLEYLRDLQNLPLPQQKQTLENTIHSWQGENRQTDDILVIGIEIP
jgi:PAS domain S-box-containing protein